MPHQSKALCKLHKQCSNIQVAIGELPLFQIINYRHTLCFTIYLLYRKAVNWKRYTGLRVIHTKITTKILEYLVTICGYNHIHKQTIPITAFELVTRDGDIMPRAIRLPLEAYIKCLDQDGSGWKTLQLSTRLGTKPHKLENLVSMSENACNLISSNI